MLPALALVLPLATSALVAPGTPAPSFSLKNQDGRTISLASLRGHTVVLWFYPKDRTPG